MKLAQAVLIAIVGCGLSAAVRAEVAADPAAPREPGIYYYSPAKTLTKIPVGSYDKTKSGFGFFAGYGQQTKQKAVIEGAHAPTQIAERQPVFYFHFAAAAATGLGETAAQSPDDYVLSPMDIKKNNQERRLTVGKSGLYSSKSGADTKRLTGFTVEKVGANVYKVRPEKDLADGEYCFFRPVGGQGTFFDFGIKTTSAAK